MDPLDQLRSRFTGLRLWEETTAGRVYAAADDTGSEVTIVVLVGAAANPDARSAFAEAVWQHSVGRLPGRATVTAADLHTVFPWAATRTPPGESPGEGGAEQLLAGVLDRLAEPAGAAALPGPVPAEPASPLPILPGPVAPPGRSWRARLTSPGGPWPWLLGAAGGVLLVLVAAAAIGGVQALRAGDAGSPGGGPTGGQVASGQPPVAGDPDLPQLRQVEPASVLGPAFGPDEATDTMAFVGWPFAFRTPPGWQCYEERLEEFPDAEFYRCDGSAVSAQLAGILLWECPTTCSEEERQAMLRAWIDEPEFMERRDGTPTYFVETGRNQDGLYSVDLGHFAAAEPGGPPRWLVGVYVESPVEARAGVQKILNDIVGQATF